MALMLRSLPLMARSAKTTDVHKNELIEDMKQSRAGDSVRVCSVYLDDPAAALAASGVPACVVHTEKGGDGGLTDAERATLDAAANVTLVTVPCSVFLLPDEVPDRVARVIADAVAHVS